MRRTASLLALTFLAAALAARPAAAQAPAGTTAVEEDWQAVIATPDPTNGGPQLLTVMSPNGDIRNTPYFLVNLNVRENTSTSPSTVSMGGVQVQCWSGRTDLTGGSVTQGTAQLNTPGETIAWTQRMALDSGTIGFSIKAGRSTTWGNFGPPGLTASFPSALTALTGYAPGFSASQSGVGWQKQNVTSMTLVQVRYYAGTTLLQTDTTARQVAP